MSVEGNILRPPGACNERDFLLRCIHCGQCAQVCPYGSVRLREKWGVTRHTPEVQPRTMPCYLCMKCPPVCPTGALDPKVTDMKKAGMGHAVIIKDRCHNFNGGIMCWTCYDRCPLRGSAIVLEGGLIPRMTRLCVGCGICDYICPVRAVVTLAPGAMVPQGSLPLLPAPESNNP